MELSVRTARIAAIVTSAVAVALILFGIWSFGIWDPWELTSADIARHLAAGEPPTEDGILRAPPLGSWLVAQGFSLFGIHEWSGRLPIALTGLLAVGIAFWLVSRFAGNRAGIYAAIVTMTTPLFLFNARQMMGAAPGFLGSALVFLCAASLVFQPERAEGRSLLRGPAARAAWGVGLVLSIAWSIGASGFMLGALPPLGAVAAVAIARGELRFSGYSSDRARWIVALVVVVSAAVLGIHVFRVVAANADAYTMWIGGTPRGGNPPTFETVIEQIFHSFAPWSAVLPLALGRALAGRGETDPTQPALSEEASLRLGLALWAAFGFAAQTVFVSRFGSATFLPVIALAGSVALFFRDVERNGTGSWAAGVVVLLLSLLLLRDFRGYPAVPAAGLGLEGLSVPEDFRPSGGWAAVLGLFGLLAVLGLSVDRDERFDSVGRDLRLEGAGWAERRPLGARIALGVLLFGWPRALLREQWERGPGFRRWLELFALVAAACSMFGILSLVFGEERPYGALLLAAIISGVIAAVAVSTRLVVGIAGFSGNRAEMVARWATVVAVLATATAIACGVLGQEAVSSLAVRIGRVLAFLVPAIVLVVALGRTARFAFHSLGQWALAPLLIAGIIAGGYTSFRFQPLMSSHFSPREVYDAYNSLAGASEPLGEYRVGGRAAAYYAHGEVRELDEQAAALAFLASEGRVWLAFRSDDLAALDRAYRQAHGRHLFVADASGTRVLLATNLPMENRQNENYLADAILDAPPSVQHPVGTDFDHRVELIGYDLDLPNGRTVGPGQAFTITWYWRCIAPIPGSYQIFLHVDGMGQRLNGDHEPVQGRYPLRLWDEGDIVVDRQELRVPANYPPGEYTFFIGFYSGESRLDVVSGPADDVDRARAGTLVVR